MIKHVVVAHAMSSATEADIDRVIAGWRALPSHIEEIQTLSAGRNLGLVGNRTTIASVAEFLSVAAWQRFIEHPRHVEFRESLGARYLERDSMSIAQFEI